MTRDIDILKSVYKAVNRDFDNYPEDVNCLLNVSNIPGISSDVQDVLYHYISGVYKETWEVGIIPTDYLSYLFHIYPLEIKNGHNIPKTIEEFKKEWLN